VPLPDGGSTPPLPDREPNTNHTVSPQVFVTTLCSTIERAHMQSRSDVQSFDFRTLQLVEEQFPAIPTVYLTEDPAQLSTSFVPPGLRQP
jgi:glycerophosphoryl diester phosphodiesterase